MKIFNNNANNGRIIETSFTGNLSNNINCDILKSAERIVYRFIYKKEAARNPDFMPEASWLGDDYRILIIDGRQFLLGIFIEQATSILRVSIEDYPRQKEEEIRPKSIGILSPGRIKSVKIDLSSNLRFDPNELAALLYNKIESSYNAAIVDFTSGMREFTDHSGSDEFYNVIRKSFMLKSLIKDISLYCVFENEGRHLPCAERLLDFVPRISMGIPTVHVDPLTIASEFFLTPLNGKKNELYTQLSCRHKRTFTAEPNKYSGTSEQILVKMATEAFFNNAAVNVQWLVTSGDSKWILSAIYPKNMEELIEGELRRLKPEFAQVMECWQKQHRASLNRLKLLYVNSASSGKSWPTLLGEFLMGLANGL
jgi:hypothetical protein